MRREHDEANNHRNDAVSGARFHADRLEPGVDAGAWENGNGEDENGGVVPDEGVHADDGQDGNGEDGDG